MGFRRRYWSCSKFSEWLRNKVFKLPKKPQSATSTDWKKWDQEAKSTNKFGYYFTEVFLDDLQDFINWPFDKIKNFISWVDNRYITKTHYIKTGLKPGEWHETDTKILHGMFEELVEFVECQKATMDSWASDKNSRSFIPWTEKFWITRRLIPWRSQHHGVNYLLWEIGLKKDDVWFGYKWREEKEPEKVAKERAENPEYMKPTPQAEAALEILELYCWWKFIRPNRPDPNDVTGYTDWFNKKHASNNGDLLCLLDKEDTDEEKQEWKKFHDAIEKIEEDYDREDEEMMIRLIKIRHFLWT